MTQCPICKTEIEDDELVDILNPQPEGIDKEGTAMFFTDNLLIRKRGFETDKNVPKLVSYEICHVCGAIFVPKEQLVIL